MPEYLSPGVYVEEIELGAQPIEGVSTSVAGLVGVTIRGPQEPRLVTGFEEFKRLYGGYMSVDQSTLPFAVEGFFNNGGQLCWVGRITGNGAATMTADLPLGGGTQVQISAVGPGDWANRIAAKIDAGSLGQPRFKLTVMYWNVAPPQPALAVTGISKANPAVVTAPAHGLATGALVIISGATHDWAALNGTRSIIRKDADNFSVAVDTTAFANNFDGTIILPIVDPTDPLQIINPNRREPTLLEVYDNVSANGSSIDFYETRINGTSSLIRIDHLPLGGAIPAPAAAVPPLTLAMLAASGAVGTNGGAVAVTAVTKANPTLFSAAAHGLPGGSSVIIGGATGDWAALNGTWPIVVPDVDHFSIAVDSTAFNGNFNGTIILPIALADFQGFALPSLPDGTVRRTGLLGFEEIDDISIVAAPDEHSMGAPLTIALITHCTLMRYRFAVLSSNPATDSLANIANIQPPMDTTYAAFYFPWIKVFNPLINQDSLIPPVGHIAGLYADTDINRGVFKSPANEVVVGATSLQFQITKREQDILNPRGVNCMRVFQSRGLRVWGARTASQDTLWKYINVRRFFLFLGQSLDVGTQWVVFENNDERLWARVNQTISQFLTTQWRAGALMGTKPSEAYFVKVDRTTMSQDDIDNGRLIVIIGVAVVKPTEFVILRLTQFPGGSSVTS